MVFKLFTQGLAPVVVALSDPEAVQVPEVMVVLPEVSVTAEINPPSEVSSTLTAQVVATQ